MFIGTNYLDIYTLTDNNARYEKMFTEQAKKKKPIRLSRVRGVAAKIPLFKSRKCVWYLSGKYGETRKYCLLLVGKWNGNRHLVFWSLGTLTGLRDWVRGLVA
jgi:hypothetical protein